MRTTVILVMLALIAVGAAPAQGFTPNTERVSVATSGRQGNADSPTPFTLQGIAVSIHGRYVAFDSTASTLVGNDTNGQADVFVRDRVDGTTRRVSVSSSGRQANDAS